MRKTETFVFAGGGTGGHLFPGMAVANELSARDPDAEIVFVGSERGLEREIVQQNNYRHVPLPVEPSTTLRRNPVRFFWKNWQARSQAITLLSELNPSAVIGLGGFASVPVVLAASSRNISRILLEQNIVPGRATRWLISRASCLCLAFDETARHLKSAATTQTTGNPVGRQIVDLYQQSATQPQQGPPTLLILGGSQGATAVNQMALGAIESLLQSNHIISTKGAAGATPVPLRKWTIMHQTGTAQHDEITARYASLGMAAETAPFFNDMPQRYAQASIAITRGGATSLAELAVAGVPAIIVPYPNSIGDHQRLNARYYETNRAARIVEQSEDSISTMTNTLAEMACNRNRLRAMSEAMSRLAKPHAATAVADLVKQLASTQVQRRRSA